MYSRDIIEGHRKKNKDFQGPNSKFVDSRTFQGLELIILEFKDFQGNKDLVGTL